LYHFFAHLQVFPVSPPYSYNYRVLHTSSSLYGPVEFEKKEKTDLMGNTIGEYTVLLPDGIVQLNQD
jgi:hypothetical protein